MDETEKLDKKKEKFNQGVTILILLGALTIGEFAIASVGKSVAVVLMLVALLKAGLVIRDYMHIGRLFSGAEE